MYTILPKKFGILLFRQKEINSTQLFHLKAKFVLPQNLKYCGKLLERVEKGWTICVSYSGDVTVALVYCSIVFLAIIVMKSSLPCSYKMEVVLKFV